VSETAHDQLKPALERANAELAKHLDEACETDPDDVTRGSVDELMRLEEELLAAARAADEAVRLRRRIQEGGNAGETPGANSAATASPPAASGGRVREFRDSQQRAWRVWEVRPGVGRPLSHLTRYLGDYVNGWLAFGCLDNDIRKRLPSYPANWLELTNRELESLLNQAIDVRRKETRPPSIDAKPSRI
jgi:hypothetical protein